MTNPKDLTSRAQRLAASVPARRRVAFAQAFAADAFQRYARGRSFLSRPAPPIAASSTDEARALADALGAHAAGLAVPHANHVVCGAYAALLPDGHRAAHGVFYTPPALVGRLLDAASAAGVDWRRARVVDPACGSGAFLVQAATRMLDAEPRSDPDAAADTLSARLRGLDRDPFAAWLSAVFLDATLAERFGPRAPRLDLVTVTDSLGCADTPAADLVIGNPPYGRVALSRARRAAYARSLYGHANLYGLFLDLGMRMTKPGGLVAYVTPASFLGGQYFKRLRAVLAEQAPPLSVELVAGRAGVFDDVLQETLLAVFGRGRSPGPVRVAFARQTAARGPASSPKVAVTSLPRDREAPWILPRTPEQARTVARLRRSTSQLADWGYDVRTGPLVWNRHKDRLRARAGPETVPLIWAEAVRGDGRFRFGDARREALHFVRGEDEHLLVRAACVLVQRTTAKEQRRRVVAAELPAAFLDEHGAVTVENHLNMVVPVRPDPPIAPRTLAAFLNSRAADDVFRCISGSVAVSAFELSSMPLPDARTMALSGLVEAADAANAAAVDEACARAYGFAANAPTARAR